MSHKCAAVFAAFFVFAGSLCAHAQDVTLTSIDGAVEVTGDLLGFDGEFYRVDTIYGELTVDGSGVTCEGPGCPNLQDFVAHLAISGSSTMGEVLMPALVEAFASQSGYAVERETVDGSHFVYVLKTPETHKEIGRFSFRVSNTDEGFADLLANEADLVMALREIRPDERQRARDAGLGDMTTPNRSRVLALDALVPVVAPGNPVRAISTPDLAAVLSGQISNWQDLGGPDAPVALHLPALGSGMNQAIEDRVFRQSGTQPPLAVVRHPHSSALAAAVAADPFALGIASYAETGNAQVLTLTGDCGFSISATRRSIKTEDYPFTSPMFLYLPARRLPQLAREFLSFAHGPVAQIVIRRAGFVDQAPEEIAINAQGDRFTNAISVADGDNSFEQVQRMVKVLSPMMRLTTSFRFEVGSARLDAQSRSNVEQLAATLEAGAYDARRLLFVGFSDGVGAAAGNQIIAKRRAEAVRRAVVAAAETANLDSLTLEVDAFGESMPMACDDSDWGRQVNRRVEVWVR
jgi:phosphate transport system substrate-binding protein